MESCDPIGTPMEIKDKLDLDQNGTPVGFTKYRSMIGALMYLTSSRPDIVHATCLCARYQAKPTEKHLKEKQDCKALSTPEAKYMSLSACCAQVLWMRTQLIDYGFHFNKIPIYYDSKSAIAISCNPVQHSRTKHIGVRYHFIKEHVEKGTTEQYFVKTDYQLADIFTKALPADRFNYLVRRLDMRSLSPKELKDADYAGCKDSFKITSGGAQFLGEKLLTDYGFIFKKIPIYCDSKSAIAISCNPVQHSRTKHIAVRYHFIKDHVENGSVNGITTSFQLSQNSSPPCSIIKDKYMMKAQVEELKKHLQIVSNDEDDVYTKATPLALKVHVVDYQIHHEHNKPFYKIIKADGTHQLFLSFITLLRNIDREDLEMLWKLVQEIFQSSKPKNFSDDFLLNTFKTMFEKPNVEASI
nr:retrotransposon protein, putative, unclassified [Tanacetum cinerariifolium]